MQNWIWQLWPSRRSVSRMESLQILDTETDRFSQAAHF